MTLARICNRPVVVHRFSQSGTDVYGNPAETWTADATSRLVWIEQTDATEVTVDRDVQKSDWLLVDPEVSGAAGQRDRVVFDGVTLEVVGPPQVTWTPRGAHHVEARLVHVEA